MTKNIRTSDEIVGKKLGMTHHFTSEGEAIPVTVVELSENIITDIKTPEKHGYAAVQVGSFTKKEKALNKPKLGFLKKNNLPTLSFLKEFRVKPEELQNYKVAEKLDLSKILTPNEYVDVTGISIGKGFQGMVKLHHIARGPKSHGSKSYRQPGSIGAGTDPGRVLPGKKMPSRMGNKQACVRNLQVIEFDQEKNIVLIRGAVPGKEGSVLRIKSSIKKWN